MAEILIAACPHVGHVSPLLNVARGLVRRGHSVTFLTSGRFAEQVRATGATACALPYGADHRGSLDELPGRAETSAVARLNVDVEQVFVRPMPLQAAALDELMATTRVDVLLTDAFFFGVLPMLLGDPAARPSVLSYTMGPLSLTSRDTAPGGTGISPHIGATGRLRNHMLNFVAQKYLLRRSHLAANTMLKALGHPKLPVFLLDSAILADRVIVPTVPEFEYHRSDLPKRVRFVGAVNPLPADGFVAPPWWRELGAERPVVHVTQGTVDDPDLSRLVEPTVEALADEDVTVVVTTGGRPVRELHPLPPNTFATEFIPHDILLPSVDVMVTNGGYGAVQRALTAGVPLVVAGNTEVAARVEWFGVGVNLRTGEPTPAMVKRAVRQVVGDHAYRNAARNLQCAHARRDGVAAIADLVDEVVAERRLGASAQPSHL